MCVKPCPMALAYVPFFKLHLLLCALVLFFHFLPQEYTLHQGRGGQQHKANEKNTRTQSHIRKVCVCLSGAPVVVALDLSCFFTAAAAGRTNRFLPSSPIFNCQKKHLARTCVCLCVFAVFLFRPLVC